MARPGARTGSSDSFQCALVVADGWRQWLLAAAPVLIGLAGLLAAAAGIIGEMGGQIGEVVTPPGAVATPSGSVALTGSAGGKPRGAGTMTAVLTAFAAVAVGVVVAVLTRRRRRVRNVPAGSTDHRVAVAGLLRIAVDGHMWWQAGAGRASLPLRPLRWYAGRRVTWIHASVSPGAARLQLLLWRTSADDAAWRKLQAWLVWCERGGRQT
jgi:hypothetical protein